MKMWVGMAVGLGSIFMLAHTQPHSTLHTLKRCVIRIPRRDYSFFGPHSVVLDLAPIVGLFNIVTSLERENSLNIS